MRKRRREKRKRERDEYLGSLAIYPISYNHNKEKNKKKKKDYLDGDYLLNHLQFHLGGNKHLAEGNKFFDLVLIVEGEMDIF